MRLRLRRNESKDGRKKEDKNGERNETRMKTLSALRQGEKATIAALKGDSRFMTRAVSIGLTPGCAVEMVRHEKNRPLLLYSRDTMIALNEKDGDKIMVED